MPTISVNQFIAIADRIAAIYGLLMKVDQQVNSAVPEGFYQNGASYPGRLQVDLTGTGTTILLTANISGNTSNPYSFTMVNPGTASSALASISAGTSLGISLQTDANKNIISTPEDVVSLIQTSSDFNDISVTYPVGNISGLVIPFSRTSFNGVVGIETTQMLPNYTIMTLRGGSFGNQYTITINDPLVSGSDLDVDLNGPDLVIDLAGDPGSPTTTVGDLATAIAAMQGSSDIFQYSTVSNFIILFQDPTYVITAQSRTQFSGGGNGPITNILLTPPAGSRSGTADSDVVQMVPSAKFLDSGITADSLYAGVNVIDQFMAALANHFTLTGIAGGLQGFLTANNILVHENFSTINTSRVGAPLLAANVFTPNILVLATLAFTGTGMTFTAGTPLGTGSGTQSGTNFGPQGLVAIIEPAGGTLAADVVFTLSLLGDDGLPKTSNSITFTAGTASGSRMVITAPNSTGRFYSVTSATRISGGSSGDKVLINQTIERQISL
jgi:hypothetical protein